VIRTGTADDAAAVAALWTQAYTGDPAALRTEPYTVADVTQWIAEGRLLIAQDAGAIVGAVVLSPPDGPGWASRDGEADLVRLAVDRAARGQGTGRALASRCVELAREAGWAGLALWSRPLQTPAHRLYESLGFARAPERDAPDRIVFVLTLEP
jgi:ribosomal protein S18 acetylase RimI-like enzyme